MKAEVDLNKNALILIKSGKLEFIEEPTSGYGKQSVLWQDGVPVKIEVNHTKKI